MANAVYTTLEIKLQDGSEVELKPLNIKGLRKFYKKIEELDTAKDQFEVMDCLIEAAAICIERQRPEFVEDKDAFEEVLDTDTMYKIIEVCGGVKLNDPEVAARAMEIVQNQDGKTSTS